MPEDQAALQREAERLGLAKVAAQFPEQFAKAKAAAERYVSRVPRDLSLSAEPAHAFRASQEA